MKYSFSNIFKNPGSWILKIKTILFLLIILSHTPFSYCQQQAANKPVDSGAIENNYITTVFLVRHAEKLKSESKDPGLHPDGIIRAAKLCKMLLKTGINKIYSTDYIRTRETVKPLADSLNIDIQLYKPGDTKIIREIMSDSTGSKILIAGHSNTIPQLVNQITGEKKYKDLKNDEYNKLFIVSLTENSSKCIILQY